MLFQPHVVDVGRHVELRFRRVFPVSWETGLKESYQQALEKYQKQIELEKELWQTMQEASVLKNRVDILGWFRLNLSELQKAIASGDLSGASEFISKLREEIERREAEERELLRQKESQFGRSVSYSTGSTGYAYVSQPTIQTQTQKQAQTEVKPAYTTATGGKVCEVKVGGQTTGYYAVNPQGQGISTRDLGYAVQWASQPSKPTQPTTLFGGAQNFYNPFRS